MEKDTPKKNVTPEPGYSADHAMAVVLIHGIGEQKPMDTLRGFVDSVRRCLQRNEDRPLESVELYYRPDPLSGNYETRILRLYYAGTRKRIDFYEYYWANLMKDTKKSDFMGWVWRLLLKPGKLSPRLRKIWWSLVGGVFLIALLVAGGWLLRLQGYWFFTVLAGVAVAAVPLVRHFYDVLMTHYVGDAGRYFTPTPANIDVRQRIREKGLNLLRTLHKKERYSRIVVVGHSLGSVIGYDLLRLLWPEFNDISEIVREREEVRKEDLTQMKKEADEVLEAVSQFATGKGAAGPEDFRKLQARCLRTQQALGQRWLISDFVTIGSPLCHMNDMTPADRPLSDSLRMREFPSCPPIVDEKDTKLYYCKSGFGDIPTLHHAGLFALTRWTNIFYDKDPVGGHAQNAYCNFVIPVHSDGYQHPELMWRGRGGILDISLKSAFRWYQIGGHTRYWSDCPYCNGPAETGQAKCEGSACGRAPACICKEMKLKEFLQAEVGKEEKKE